MKRKALLVLGLAVALTCSNVVSVYAAEGENYSIETYSNNNNKVVAAGSEQTDITGDVSVTGNDETAVKTSDNAKVSVKGNVSADGNNTYGVWSTDNSSVSVQGNVSASGESAEGVASRGNSSVKVSGDVTAEGGITPSGVDAVKGSSVTVDGTVKAVGSQAVGINSKGEVTAGGVLVEGADSTGVNANNGGSITINNDVKVVERNRGTYSVPVSGVETESNGEVTVEGNVEVEGIGSIGIKAAQGEVTVNGNVKASGTKSNSGDETVGISASSSKVNVKGDVTSDGKGIHIIKSGTGLNSIVEVNGSVTGGSGVVINNGSDVTVGGDITATGGTGLDITLEDATGRGKINLGTLNVTKEGETGVLLDVRKRNIQNIDELIQAMPEVNLFEINVKQGDYFGINDGTTRDTISGTNISKKEAADEILKKKVKYSFRTEKTSNANITLEKNEATEGTTVKFYVKAEDGYQVKGVSAGKAKVIDNGDGSYSIIVPRGGGVNISAIIEAVMKEQPGGQSSSSGEEYTAANEEYATAVVKYTETQKQTQQTIKNIERGGNCVVELDKYISFNRETFEALSKRPDVSLTVIYKWNGVKYKVTIPAGYNVLDLLNEDGYCGCLYLNAIFGSQVVE